jgi:hypothetical protein
LTFINSGHCDPEVNPDCTTYTLYYPEIKDDFEPTEDSEDSAASQTRPAFESISDPRAGSILDDALPDPDFAEGCFREGGFLSVAVLPESEEDTPSVAGEWRRLLLSLFLSYVTDRRRGRGVS